MENKKKCSCYYNQNIQQKKNTTTTQLDNFFFHTKQMFLVSHSKFSHCTT